MDGLHIIIDSDAASDSWGFVGVVRVGEVEAYRTLQAYPTPDDAVRAAQDLVADFLGGVLAGREWQHVRDDHGHLPLRKDFNFSVLGNRFRRSRDGGWTAEEEA
jgi:hypothetical protein